MDTTALRRFRMVLWGLVAVAAVAATVLFVVVRTPIGPQGVATLGGGDYRLVAHTGETVDASIFLGHPSLLFFGFTHCPDVCPTTLGDMAAWYEELGDEAKDLKAYFVTVDPERDTPEIVGAYASWLGPQMTGVSGSRAEIDKIIRAWGVTAEKVPLSDGGYNMAHTASVFLVDAQGRFEGTIAYEESRETALGKIRKLLASS